MGKTFNALINAGAHTIGFPPVSQVCFSDFYLLLNGFLYGNYCLAYKEINHVLMVKAMAGFIRIEIEHSIPGYPKFSVLLRKGRGLTLFNLLKEKVSECKEVPVPSRDLVIIHQYRKNGSNPIRKLYQVLIPVIWVALILSDMLLMHPDTYIAGPFGFLTVLAFAFLFFIGFLLLFNGKAREILLKPGRGKSDIDRSVWSLLLFLLLTIAGLFVIPV